MEKQEKDFVVRFAFWDSKQGREGRVAEHIKVLFCFGFCIDLLDKSCYLPLKVRKVRSYIFVPVGEKEESSRVGKHKCLPMGNFEGWILNVGT